MDRTASHRSKDASSMIQKKRTGTVHTGTHRHATGEGRNAWNNNV